MIDDYAEKETLKKVRNAAAEGTVLLENNGILPLPEKKNKIALYGAGAVLTVKGGSGSGDVMLPHVVSIEEALEKQGFIITTKEWLDDYRNRHEKAEEKRFLHMRKDAEETGDPLMSVFLRHPQVYADGAEIPRFAEKNTEETAVYVISRISGECADRNAEEGDYYLSKAERRHIEALAENYQDVVIVLNTGGVMDTGFYREIPGLSAMLQISQAGAACGIVLADILSGKAFPSGKLTATWAERYSDYPTSSTFRDNRRNEKRYEEGIYVGYRYFDTFHKKPAYAFGYGKTYTEFSWSVEKVTADSRKVELQIAVTNIGKHFAGKEVIQIYVSSPSGQLEKPFQELKAYKKTKTLLPGEKQLLTISFQTTDMASYDEKSSAWILEKGAYILRVGNSSVNTETAAVLMLENTVVTEQLKRKLAPEQPVREIHPAKQDFIEDPMEISGKIPVFTIRTEEIFAAFVYQNEAQMNIPEEAFVSRLSLEELAALCVGTGAIGNGAVIGSASVKVPGAAGETTSLLKEKWGIPSVIFADGPAGLRLMPEYQVRNEDQSIVVPEGGFLALTGFQRLAGKPKKEKNCHMVKQRTTAIPIGSMLAQSWNPEVIREMGEIIGREMRHYGVYVWLAPAMNIQRDPLCGRNFEYYSEDPLLAGNCAAAMTQGVQSIPGCAVAVKHFVANSQEENRFDQNSIVSERTLREIYLRGFEIVVKKARPMMLMTAYNLINGVHAANNRELLTDILRTEWGFDGAVVTDWGTTRNGMRAGFGGKTRSLPEKCIWAGNNLIMPGDAKDREEIIEAVRAGKLMTKDLQKCVTGVLTLIKKLHMQQLKEKENTYEVEL